MQRFFLKVSCLILVGLSGSALAQQTIFNVPSGDVLDRRKVYGELDFAYFGHESAGTRWM
jgi:hypothetical protein